MMDSFVKYLLYSENSRQSICLSWSLLCLDEVLFIDDSLFIYSYYSFQICLFSLLRVPSKSKQSTTRFTSFALMAEVDLTRKRRNNTPGGSWTWGFRLHTSSFQKPSILPTYEHIISKVTVFPHFWNIIFKSDEILQVLKTYFQKPKISPAFENAIKTFSKTTEFPTIQK